MLGLSTGGGNIYPPAIMTLPDIAYEAACVPQYTSHLHDFCHNLEQHDHQCGIAPSVCEDLMMQGLINCR